MAGVVAAAGALAVAGAPAEPAGSRAEPQSPLEDASRWSAPALLSACSRAGTPRVVFPSDGPGRATGPGAIVWGAARGCPGGPGARLAPIGTADLPSPARRLSAPSEIAVPRAVSGGPHGEIVIAGTRSGGPSGDQLLEGPARGGFSPLDPLADPIAPPALATAYLGDVALVTSAAGSGGAGGLDLYVERYFARRFIFRAQVTGARAGSLVATTVALDYRSDALVVWARGGAIYARELPGRGAPHPVQRLAPAGSHLQIAALLSDDERAIVAWSDERDGRTSVYLDQSSRGVRFAAPTLLERFADPGGVRAPSGSPSLVRLSSESVVMAWAGARESRWAVRTAAIDQHGLRAAGTIPTPGADALLEGLAAGPDGDALVLWSEPGLGVQRRHELGGRAIFAARGIDAYPGRTEFAAPEEVAPASAGGPASVALDPASDRALVAWRTEAGAIAYSIRALSGR